MFSGEKDDIQAPGALGDPILFDGIQPLVGTNYEIDFKKDFIIIAYPKAGIFDTNFVFEYYVQGIPKLTIL